MQPRTLYSTHISPPCWEFCVVQSVLSLANHSDAVEWSFIVFKLYWIKLRIQQCLNNFQNEAKYFQLPCDVYSGQPLKHNRRRELCAKIEKVCAARESDPDLLRGKQAFYHQTSGAYWIYAECRRRCRFAKYTFLRSCRLTEL
ncbi:Hypothetical_protein [Hexamita inflata]|uniref:Hypothetical_protein n=1 Tax=Hexamita inflata TaxID=28002 RepID=A0AA86P4F8_9EUKA|nr:Hypothetical protein HINF_LOCUS9763 [Hexamita inflata]CAI9931769.1 Hypothetical protein HINF_LOCUS19414 [Hexamita inflata]